MECPNASSSFFPLPTTVGSRQVIVPQVPTRLCGAEQHVKERSVSVREPPGRCAQHHVCRPHGVRHRPRASELVGAQHDEDALQKKQMPLVQNKVTLGRTILGRSMTQCKRSRSHGIVSPARFVNLQLPRGQVPRASSSSPSLSQHPAYAKCL